MELIDVSKWFDKPVYINPDFVVSIIQQGFSFSIYTISNLQPMFTKDYDNYELCEKEMLECIKKLKGDI